jgi:predicted nucleic acid-binding Zn ribbon protein
VPIYEFICPRCETKREIPIHVNDIGHSTAFCECTAIMNRVWNVAGIHYPYKESDSVYETGYTLQERGKK